MSFKLEQIASVADVDDYDTEGEREAESIVGADDADKEETRSKLTSTKA